MRLIAIFISLTVAVIFFFFAMNYLGEKKTVVEKSVIVEKPVEVIRPEATKKVLIAARYIAPGTVIDPSMLDAQDWPERLIVDQFLLSGSPQANIVGMVARSPFQPREPLVLSKIAKQGDPSFIAATLPDGQRMVTIATDGFKGVAGFVYPGDRVDVLLTHVVEVPVQPTPQNPQAQPKQEEISEPLLVNVPVIAVDQRAMSDAGEKPVLPTSVSLQVSPEDAQKLRLSEKKGTLSLALRPIKDKGENLETPTTRFDITHFYITDPSKTGMSPMAAAMPVNNNVQVIVVRGVKSETVQIETPPNDDAPTAAAIPARGTQHAAPAQTQVPAAQVQPTQNQAAAPAAQNAPVAPAPVAPAAPAPAAPAPVTPPLPMAPQPPAAPVSPVPSAQVQPLPPLPAVPQPVDAVQSQASVAQ